MKLLAKKKLFSIFILFYIIVFFSLIVICSFSGFGHIFVISAPYRLCGINKLTSDHQYCLCKWPTTNPIRFQLREAKILFWPRIELVTPGLQIRCSLLCNLDWKLDSKESLVFVETWNLNTVFSTQCHRSWRFKLMTRLD